MENTQRAASVEFLEFLAHISNSATGEISLPMLAGSLSLRDEELFQRWDERGHSIAWPVFADEILAVLDAAQDLTLNLARTIEWYRHEPIERFGMRTADKVVTRGNARHLVQVLKQGNLPIR